MHIKFLLFEYTKSLTWMDIDIGQIAINGKERSLFCYHRQGNHKEIDFLWVHVK